MGSGKWEVGNKKVESLGDTKLLYSHPLASLIRISHCKKVRDNRTINSSLKSRKRPADCSTGRFHIIRNQK